MWQPKRDPRRRAERLRTDVVKCALGDVIDISASGVRVTSTGKPPLKTGQMIATRLSSSDGSLSVTTQVVWMKRKGLRKFEVGLRFVDLKPGVAAAIESAAKFGFFRAVSGGGADSFSSKPRQTVRAAVSLPDYYAILGIGPGATDDQIKSAYRTLARKHHPDASQDKESAQLFIQITEAYRILIDPERRRTFDLQSAA